MSEFRRSARLADRGLNSIFNTPPNRADADDATTSSEEDLPDIPLESGRQLTPLPDRNQENVSLQRLFDCVRRNPVAIAQAAKLWIRNYRVQKASALAELLSFFISGAGCPQEVLPEDVDPERLPQTIQNLIRRATELPDEDPFKAKRGRKTFKVNYGLMWSEIVKESNSAALVFDSEFVSFLTTTIIEFSKSVVRSFRFVACFVCKSVSQTWVQILKAKCETRSTTELQISNEQRKRQNKVTRKKIETLQNTLSMYQEQVQDLEKLIGVLFEEVLVHRFRDVCESVRSIVTEAIGQWCLTLPASFLTDQYLKYLAWPLSDKDSIVRQSAVQGLVSLYCSESNVLTLHEFSVRFRSRICEMVYDVDEGVAIGAIKLLTKLVQFNEIQISEIKHVYQILADDSVLMRNAVADLLCAILKENAKNSSTDQIDQSEDRIMLCGIINIFCELANAQDPEAMEEDLSRSWTDPQILTEQTLPIKKIKDFLSPFYDRLDLLKDWELLIDQLNDSRNQSGIKEGWFLMFIKILDCCVQLTHAGSKETSFLRSRKLEIEEKQREEMTSKLMEWLVSWINEFQTDGEKVVCFIRILRHLKTELFILKSLTSSYVGILQNVMEVCFKHHQSEVIEECIGTLSILGLTGPQELRTVSIDFLKMTSDRILQDLTESVNSVFNGVENEEQYLTLSVTLERIKHLLIIEQHELLDTVNLTHSLTTLFTVCSENLQLSERFGIDLSQCGFLLILWSLVPRQDPVPSIGSFQNEIQSCLFTILSNSEKSEIQWEASCLMVDLYLMFGHESPPLGCSRLLPEDWMFSQLWTVLENRIQQDLKIEELIQDLVVVGKLITYGNLTTAQLKRISGQFFSLITHPKSAIVELVKKVGRHVRKLNPRVLMEGYLSAMFEVFESTKNGEKTIQDFTSLAQRFANSYLVFNNTIEQSRMHVLELVKEGIQRATNSEELKIDFIKEGLICFNKKLPIEAIPQLIRELEDLQNSIPQDQYNSLKTYIQSLEGRVKRPEVGGQSSGGASEDAGEDGQLESKLRTPFSALPVESASTSEGEEVQIGEVEELEAIQEHITRRRRSKTSIGARVSLSGDEGSSRKKPRI